MMAITRQQAGKLRINGSFPGIGKGVFIYFKTTRSAVWPTQPPLKGCGKIILLQ